MSAISLISAKCFREFSKSRLGVVLILAGFGLVSCGKSSKDSALDHNVGEPVRGTAAWQWHELSDDDLKEVFLPFQAAITQQRTVLEIPEEDVITERVQSWIDRFDENVRSRYPDELKNTPKPTAILRLDPTANAFIMPVPVCFTNVGIVFRDGEDLEEGGAIVRPDKIFSTMFNETCVRKTITMTQAKSFTKWLNKTQRSCKYSVREGDASEIEVMAVGCEREEKIADVAGFTELHYLPTANRVNVHSGILGVADEGAFAAVMAHELGHYYRSHSTSAVNDGVDYNYFYELKRRNPDEKPKAEPKLKAFGEKVRSINLPSLAYSRTKGQKYLSEFFIPMNLMARYVGSKMDCDEEDTDCNYACAELAEFVAHPKVKFAFGKFPFTKISPRGTAIYGEFEKRVTQCFAGVVVDGDDEELGKSIPADFVKDALTLDKGIAKLLASFEPKGALSQVIKKGTDQYLRELAKLKSVLDSAAKKRLGYYTVEQEADELSVEWMSDVGMQPEHAVEMALVLTKLKSQSLAASGTHTYPNTISSERCIELSKNDWKDENGNYVFVPIADYVDTHHSGCFRAFNIAREVEAHKLAANRKADKIKHPTSDSWGDLGKRVNEYHRQLGSAVMSVPFADADGFPEFSTGDVERLNIVTKDCAFLNN